MNDILVIIPIRLKASRFPNKPFAKIGELPMLHHVYNRVINFTENVIPEFDGVPGLMSMTAAITGETSGVNMATWESKEAADAVAEKIQAALAGAASFMSGPPTIYEGAPVFGKIYQTIEKDSQRPSYLRLVVGVAKDTDAVLNFLKEKVEPIYEESDGIQLAGAIFDGNNAISWNFWDSKEAMDAAVVKLEAELDSAEEEALFESATAYMGPVYAGRIFVEFTEGSTCLLYTSDAADE